MRLVSYLWNDISSIGVLNGDRVIDLPSSADLPSNMVAFLQRGDEAMNEARAVLDEADAGDGISVDDITWLPVVTNPEKVLCLGKNYYAHINEMGTGDAPTSPLLFHKTAGSLNAHNGQIVIPPVTKKVDYEAELAVIIGKTCRNVTEEDAFDYIAGYTAANDVSARDLQRATTQFTAGKMLDTFGPLGPTLVTKDEIEDVNNLRIQSILNGEVMQDSNTSLLIFGIAHTIAYVSSFSTLKPGDVLLTGTPGGVGIARDPQVLLKSGDEITVVIEGVGTLTNTVA